MLKIWLLSCSDIEFQGSFLGPYDFWILIPLSSCSHDKCARWYGVAQNIKAFMVGKGYESDVLLVAVWTFSATQNLVVVVIVFCCFFLWIELLFYVHTHSELFFLDLVTRLVVSHVMTWLRKAFIALHSILFFWNRRFATDSKKHQQYLVYAKQIHK